MSKLEMQQNNDFSLDAILISWSLKRFFSIFSSSGRGSIHPQLIRIATAPVALVRI